MDQLFTDLQNNININPDAIVNANTNANKDTEKLLKKQQISTEKLNSLLEQSLTTLSCGPVCQKAKIEKALKQKYQDAQTNIQTAPIQLETTKRNYYVFTEGKPFYDNMLEEELKKKGGNYGEIVGGKLSRRNN
jgi:hypothetical protein